MSLSDKKQLSAKKKYIFSVIVIIVSSIIPLLVAEMGLRIFYPQSDSMRWFKSSKKYGHLVKEDFYQKYTYRAFKSKFTMHVQTNSLGHRYKQYNQADFDNPEYKKVLLLGDSFLFGHGVDMDDHIATNLTNMLNEDKNRFSIINTGVSGWGTLQETTYAKDHFELFNPDIIVLLFCSNDPDNDDDFMANKQKGLLHFLGKIFLIHYSHLYRFLYFRLYVLSHSFELAQKLENNENLTINEQTGRMITADQWERTLNTIEEFHAEYLEFNKSGLLLVLSTSPWNEEDREKLSSLSNGQNLMFVDLYNETIGLPPEKRRLKHDGHWSELMHFISANKISESILSQTQ